MGAQPTGRIVLLSIKPAYADAIFAGRKTIEFRRSRIAADIDIVLVYATRPVGQVVGWFEVAGVVESTPSKLWRDYSDQGGIDRHSYVDYFSDTGKAFGILVRRATRLTAPARLEQISPGIRPPQSFQYLAPDAAAAVLAA